MSKQNNNGRQTVAPIAPPTFEPQAPEFPTTAIQFPGLPCVALIVPKPTSTKELSHILGVIVQQLMASVIDIEAAAAQPSGKILGPDEPVADPTHD